MMKLSKQTDYALQLLIELGKLGEGRVVSLKFFAIQSNISFLFLQQIARQLKQAGIIQATRGTKGGYALVKPLHEITMKEIIDVIDGPYGLTPCLKDEMLCPKQEDCTMKPGMKKMNDQIVQYMTSMRVSEFV